jgi:hypothetical protein
MKDLQPSEAQQELLTFINPLDAPDIAIGLRKVLNMALYENPNPLTVDQKDDLFYLEKIITIVTNM